MIVNKKQVHIKDIVPFEDNPRRINKIAREKLKRSIIEIPDFLKARPLIIDEENNLIAGHQRYDILLELNYEYLDCIEISQATEDEIRRIRIIDNINNGEWDFNKLDKLKYDWKTLNSWNLYKEQKPEKQEVDMTEPEMVAIFSYISLYTSKDIFLKLTEKEAEMLVNLIEKYENEYKTTDHFIEWLLKKIK